MTEPTVGVELDRALAEASRNLRVQSIAVGQGYPDWVTEKYTHIPLLALDNKCVHNQGWRGDDDRHYVISPSTNASGAFDLLRYVWHMEDSPLKPLVREPDEISR